MIPRPNSLCLNLPLPNFHRVHSTRLPERISVNSRSIPPRRLDHRNRCREREEGKRGARRNPSKNLVQVEKRVERVGQVDESKLKSGTSFVHVIVEKNRVQIEVVIDPISRWRVRKGLRGRCRDRLPPPPLLLRSCSSWKCSWSRMIASNLMKSRVKQKNFHLIVVGDEWEEKGNRRKLDRANCSCWTWG